MRKLLGDSTARAIDFYCDPQLLAEDPIRYQDEMEKIFGIGADVIGDVVIKEVHLQLGLQQRLGKIRKSLADEIREMQDTYRSKYVPS